MTGTNMTAREMAQHGLEQIESAICLLLTEQGPLRPHQVADALGQRHPSNESERSAKIIYAIMESMANRGILAKGPGNGSAYSVRARAS